MTNKRLAAALTAATFLVSGVAFAAERAQEPPASSTATTEMKTAEKDFGKVSQDASLAYQDIALARLAIFEGQTNEAKKLASDADGALAKAKTADTTLMRADVDLRTPGMEQGKDSSSAQPAEHDGSMQKGEHQATAYLPVYSTITLGEAYKVSPEKRKAVADANESLRKGDQKGAIDKLKLANVDMSIVEAVLPLNQTIADVHDATTMINDGKFYEGSQVLRKVQASVRFDISNYKEGANGHLVYSHVSDIGKAAAGGQMSQASAAGEPEPYTAPDPQYKPMGQEPVMHGMPKSAPPSLTEH